MSTWRLPAYAVMFMENTDNPLSHPISFILSVIPIQTNGGERAGEELMTLFMPS